MPRVDDLKIPALKVYLVKIEEPAFAALRPLQRFALANLARHCHIADEVDGGEAARIWRDVAGRLARQCIREYVTDNDVVADILKAWMLVVNAAMVVGADGEVVTA